MEATGRLWQPARVLPTFASRLAAAVVLTLAYVNVVAQIPQPAGTGGLLPVLAGAATSAFVMAYLLIAGVRLVIAACLDRAAGPRGASDGNR